MEKVAECYTTQLIEGNGTFNADGLDEFIRQVKLEESGLSYAIVSVMGPQSSGKSTLLNHLFRTKFVEMDAKMGRNQTTKGIWIARCTDIKPCTIVMDLEGTDGKEREDDTSFEIQSALFAIAVSHIVIINMWCHDIGRERGAVKPLLRTVFELMLWRYSPRKTTLVFVLRDKTKSPPEKLELDLRNDIQKIWDSVPKQDNKDTHLSKFLNVEVVALSSYEDEEDLFNEQVASLRQRFFHSIAPGGLADDRQGVIPDSGLSISMKSTWESIKENKVLTLPKHATMVANERCEEIVSEKYSSFVSNMEWLELRDEVKYHHVENFGKNLSLLLDNSLSSYDEEVMQYDGNVRSAKRKQLHEKLMQLVKPSYKLMFQHIQSKALDNFKNSLNIALKGHGFAVAASYCRKTSMSQFDELCEDARSKHVIWDDAKVRINFSHDLDSHITDVRAAKLFELATLYESNIEEALCSDIEAVLKLGSDDTWRAIRKHFHGDQTKTLFSNLSLALDSFEMDVKEKEDIISKLKNHARGLVEGKAKYEACIVLSRMKERFIYMFFHHDDSKSRDSWTGDEDIPAIAKTSYTCCLKLLSIFAAIRLDEDETDTIWDTLLHSLVEQKTISTSNDPLNSTTWDKVSPSNTLLSPVQCKSLWNQFQSDTEYIISPIISQATISQEASAPSNDTAVQESSNNVVGVIKTRALAFGALAFGFGTGAVVNAKKLFGDKSNGIGSRNESGSSVGKIESSNRGKSHI